MRTVLIAAGFTDELTKLALGGMPAPVAAPVAPAPVAPAPAAAAPSFWQRAAPYAGALGGAALATAGVVAARPALRAHVGADVKALFKGQNAHAIDRAQPLHPAAAKLSKQVADHLRSQGIDPSKARIGISATGGTGKSSLAKGLAGELGMSHQPLDDSGKSLLGRDLVKHVRDNGIQPGTVAEQTHLLNQVDPDHFDAIIHLEKPMGNIKKQILKRGRGAAQLEVYNYDKLNQSVRTGFDMTQGAAHEVAPGVRIKMKGQGGFGSHQMLTSHLQSQGIDPTGLNRERMVMSAASGKRTTAPGVLPYLRRGRIATGAGIVGAGGVAGGIGAHQMVQPEQSAG